MKLFQGQILPAIAVVLFWTIAAQAAPPSGALPDRVTFASADGHTTLVGYVFNPEGQRSARVPAVVMMHGRAGAYSSAANGRYDATTLSRRHQEWGHIWAQQAISPSWWMASVHAATRMASRDLATISDLTNSMKSRYVHWTLMVRWLICGRVATSSPIALQYRDGPMVEVRRSRRCHGRRLGSVLQLHPPAFGPGWCSIPRAH